MRLYWRIVFPFALGLVALVGAGTLMATWVLARDADRRLEEHLGAAAERIAHGGFAFTPALLAQLKVAVAADVVVVGPGGTVITSTLDERVAEEAAALAGRSASGTPRLAAARVGASGYRVLSIAMPAEAAPVQALAFFAPLAPLDAARGRLVSTLVLMALAGLLLMLAWGHFVTRSITRPLDRLVESTRIVAGGDLAHTTARPRIPELAALAEAFDQMIAKIAASEARLVRSERLAAMGQIAATVAHEVRNPLTAMRMLAQLLGRHHADRTVPGEACTKIIGEIDRLELLVQGLLAATHDRPMRRAPVDLSRLVQEISALVGEQFRHRGIVVTEDLAAPARVDADPDRLKQLVLNLLLNAADAMPSGGTITIVTRCADGGDGSARIELTIADEGTGLSPLAQARAFEPFFTTKPEGAGLGLALCGRTAEEHGGGMRLQNRPDGGAVATVWLPLGPAGAGARLEPAPLEEAIV